MKIVAGRVDPDLSGKDEEHIKKKISDCVFAKRGEISTRLKSAELAKIYEGLSKNGRQKFMKIMARGFDIDIEKIKIIIQKLQEGNEGKQKTAEMELSKAITPPYVRLLRKFTTIPDGFKFLIDFRAELLEIKNSDPHLKKFDGDLKELLSSLFDIALLDIKEITWQSPASLLEKLIEYEAVHEIHSWADLKNRLDSDRQCFAFFHNKMPDEPIIFVQVALVDEITDSIRKLLDGQVEKIKPEEADTAVFYSISNAQKGLAGINFGNFLIKRVVNVLSDKFKELKHFVTLSPVPHFRKWLDSVLSEGDESILTPAEIKIIRAVAKNSNAAYGLLVLLSSDWTDDPGLARTLKPVLMRLCAHYLIYVKKDEKAFDPVANFHLSNGAHIERLNWLGDISEKAIRQSAGIMVNFHYKLPDIEKNYELYISESQVNASKEVRKWLK